MWTMCRNETGWGPALDTDLLGLEHMTWQSGQRSFISKCQEAGASVVEVNHDLQAVRTKMLGLTLVDRKCCWPHCGPVRSMWPIASPLLWSSPAWAHSPCGFPEVSWGLATSTLRLLVQT